MAPKQRIFAKGEIFSRIPSDDFDPSRRMGRDVRKYNVISGARISYRDARYGLWNDTSFFFTTTAKCNVWIMKIYFLLLHNNRISSDARRTIKVPPPKGGVNWNVCYRHMRSGRTAHPPTSRLTDWPIDAGKSWTICFRKLIKNTTKKIAAFGGQMEQNRGVLRGFWNPCGLWVSCPRFWSL